jgi:Xaa-Pro aminopeptidase
MIPLRSVKTKWEIEQMQKAIDITGDGIKNIFKKSKIGMMEYELDAILKYEINRNGLKHIGFKSIIASGKNAATLHYEQNDSKIGKDEMALLDVGAACNGYSADISRTFPVSGKFTKRQKEVYSEVLAINKKIIKMVKPGIGMKELNEKTVELIQKSLIKLKLIKDKKDYRKYYMHSIGHHLGMDTHDLGARDSVLEVGNVITIEPGIYIPEEKIGVRIEDDILVTKTGYKNLSENIPKEINELES